jgi:hypothetical protein
MILQPCKIFICARRVHDEQVLLLVDAIYNQVVNDPAAVIEQKCVLTYPNVELLDIIGQHAIEPGGGGGLAADVLRRWRRSHDELAHVRNVEDADIVPNCLMFLDDAGVLNGH